jgi:hypothetical protein
MIDQLPKQGGGQLLPFKGSIDRLPPACSRNTQTAAPAGRAPSNPRTAAQSFSVPVTRAGNNPPATKAAPTKQEGVLWLHLVFLRNM